MYYLLCVIRAICVLRKKPSGVRVVPTSAGPLSVSHTGPEFIPGARNKQIPLLPPGSIPGIFYAGTPASVRRLDKIEYKI